MALTINLPLSINSLDEAVKYLTMLHNTGYSYHPDDTIFDGTPEGNISWYLKEDNEKPTITEQMYMDTLMNQVHKYHDDPCLVLCELWRTPVVIHINPAFQLELYDESGQFVEGSFANTSEVYEWCDENNCRVVELFNTKN